MSTSSKVETAQARVLSGMSQFGTPGVALLGVLLALTAAFFHDGLNALVVAWQQPEYSHGPLIPVLSGLLFLRQLKSVPVNPGPVQDRWGGVVVILAAIFVASLGRLANIDDLVAYGFIIWVAGILLVSFGWRTGWLFWPGVLHLVYMLPLPGTLYYKFSTWLQYVSSELGVWFLKLMAVPVFLDGNIIDLGVMKLHVAEACSGLRYLFPILSFSYIFAVLYRGPIWHKAVLLISAAPITVLMNSVRIGVAGYIVNHWGAGWIDGFTHFFEGWVIFLICILILFGLARIMMLFQRQKMTLVEALDLETDGLGQQAMRLRFVRPSVAMATATALMLGAVLAFMALPERGQQEIRRDSFAIFPRTLDDWRQYGPREFLDPGVEATLAADDYVQASFLGPDSALPVSLFVAWYADQSQGGVHSPEICLPAGGWEIAWLERTELPDPTANGAPFRLNRAIIQKGEVRMMVYYWFQQRERRIAWDVAAKFWLLMDGVWTGRTDGALVRLTTPIAPGETDAEAEARLRDMLDAAKPTLPRFLPADDA